MVVAHNQDDVVPPELSHQIEPDMSLVGVRRHRPQERQVDALRTKRNKVLVLTMDVLIRLDSWKARLMIYKCHKPLCCSQYNIDKNWTQVLSICSCII